MPSHRVIVEHYGLAFDSWAWCFACFAEVDEWPHLERAHLVDRQHGGLDGPQNLVLLCRPCHRAMPSFHEGEGLIARRWVSEREHHMARWLRLARDAEDRIGEGMSREAAVELVCRLNRGR